MLPPPPTSTLFPYTTLFRSAPTRQPQSRFAGDIGESPVMVVVKQMTGGLLAFWKPFERDRKSTRLNSSHRCISYAVFCLKKKNKSITECWQYAIRTYSKAIL